MMAPYGHMLTTEDATRELHRVGAITSAEFRGLMNWLKRLPIVKAGETVKVKLPPALDGAMSKVHLASLMPATWTVQ